MNTKSILSCVAVVMLTASLAMASGGFSGGGARGGGGGSRGGFAGSRFGGAGSRFGGFRGDRFGRGRFNNFVFFGDFGDPFFYPYYWGYYPYGYYPYGYGYYPYGYGYGYGYNPYDQRVYPGVAAGGGSVRELQLNLARAGYYHGRIDGVMGPRTRYALRAYERSHNSRATAQQSNNSYRQ